MVTPIGLRLPPAGITSAFGADAAADVTDYVFINTLIVIVGIDCMQIKVYEAN
jgi:hypothetical protein